VVGVEPVRAGLRRCAGRVFQRSLAEGAIESTKRADGVRIDRVA
jgi:hypothetical protein